MTNIRQVITPRSLQDALKLLQEPGIRPIAAGTDIIPAARDGALPDLSLLDLTPLKPVLSGIRAEGGALRIGALTTHTSISESRLVQAFMPVLSTACGQIGSVQIRNRATLGGNIVNASPAADSVPILVAAGASVIIKTASGMTQMPIADFLVGVRKTQLPPGGLVTEIVVPIPNGGWRGGYYKVGGRTSLTIAIVSAAIIKNGDDWRVAYGSMSAKISRCSPVEAYLSSAQCAERTELFKLISGALTPISDVRASAEYRLDVAANITWLGYSELMTQCQWQQRS
jgi:CO/xanthine dehydrogenase FAD-binding subunit